MLGCFTSLLVSVSIVAYVVCCFSTHMSHDLRFSLFGMYLSYHRWLELDDLISCMDGNFVYAPSWFDYASIA